ncbi:MAG: zinc-finger domain-containing protein [Pseudomonadota bacterium]
MTHEFVYESVVKCDGKKSDKNATVGSKIGHPAVYLHVNTKDVVYCPYCSRSFVFKAISG